MARSINLGIGKAKEVKAIISGYSSLKEAFSDAKELKPIIERYPQLTLAVDIEEHARHTGKHAAGIAVCNDPIRHICSINRDGTAQMDKYDAEHLNVLKIDALGLRTLTVIDACLGLIKKKHFGKKTPHDWIRDYPLDDPKVFTLFNAERFAGIFQFEGGTLQGLCRRMGVQNFNDIVALTTLARPGPLRAGGAEEFIERRTGEADSSALHPLLEEITNETYGCIIFQEQVMAAARHMGKMSWKDVSALRKAMSKSLGDEVMQEYWKKFSEGAKTQKVPVGKAKFVWEKMRTFGAYAFNKSHAVSYALISYWCAVLKTHHMLEWTAACLMYEKDESSSVKILREAVNAGIEFIPVDAEKSRDNWSIQKGKLIGGFRGIKGIGPKKSEVILKSRKKGKALTGGIRNLFEQAQTPYDDIFEAHRRFGDIYANPIKYKLVSGAPVDINFIIDDGTYLFIAKVIEKNQQDMNDHRRVTERNGKIVGGPNLFLTLALEDDSGKIYATVDRFKYSKFNRQIEKGAWYIWKGEFQNKWNRIFVTQLRRLDKDCPTSE